MTAKINGTFVISPPLTSGGAIGCFRNTAPFVLASASPRRREMLSGLGLEFVIDAADADEMVLPGEGPEVFVVRVAEDKARIVASRHPEEWVLAADTVVALDGEMLGKPVDAAEAMSMLARLSGRWHEVWTGFCLCRGGQAASRCAVRTAVRFANLTDPVIWAYVRSGDPLDKAGGYGIQSFGGFMVQEINGSYSNVVGLPLAEVVAVMFDLGIVQPVAAEGRACC
ncbi:MAG: septum formation protein Maf [Proteobacteria bacterium]|nr:septum formation protein Maf [Desulfobulbaceae bacterium]MBU4153369.1 septum formation protein Maf [Pseudomonadota bacterium]